MSKSVASHVPALLTAFVLLVAAAYCACSFRLESSIAHLLPPASREISMLAREVIHSSASHSMVLSVGPRQGLGPAARARLEPETLRMASALAKALRSDPGVVWVRSGPEESIEHSMFELYFPRRFNFIADTPLKLSERLSAPGIEHSLADLKRALSTPASAAWRKLAPRDPLMLFERQLQRLEAARPAELSVHKGHFVASDGHALLFVGLADSAFDGDAQGALLTRIGEHFERRNKSPELVLERSGFNVFSVDSEQRIKADISRVALISAAGIVLLFAITFRSLWALFLVSLPLLAGFVGAMAGCLLVFGNVHALTLAFGASLLGVCVDYPVHLINHRGLGQHAADVPPGVRGGLVLGAVTTIVGIGALGWTEFEVLQQVAVFSGTGLLAGLACTLWVLPLFENPGRSEVRQAMADSLLKGLTRLEQNPRTLILIGVLPLLIGVFGLARATWSSSLEGLAPLNPALRLEDARVRARIGAPGSNELVVAVGANDTQALTRNDTAYARLEHARRAGWIRGFQSIHPMIWAPEAQRASFEETRGQAFAGRVTRALQAQGFDTALFAPFFEALQSPSFEPLRLRDLMGSALQSLTERFVVKTSERTVILSYPEGIQNAQKLLEHFNGSAGIYFIDQRMLLDAAYSQLRDRVRLLMVSGALLMCLLVWLRFRRPRVVAATLLPALVAPATALGTLALLGTELNLFHLFAALVVLSMAMDYGVFLSETLEHNAPRTRATGATLLSTLLAASTTCLSFGLLGFSQVPVLAAIGQTIAVGMFTALALTPLGWLFHDTRSVPC